MDEGFLDSDLSFKAANHFLPVKDELLEAARRFEEEKVENSIVFFGSARILPEEEAKDSLKELEDKISKQKDPSSKDLQLLDRARKDLFVSQFYTSAEELAYLFTEWSHKHPDPKDHFLVCSGGGPGIMEASNRGAHRAGGRSIGLAIQIPYEQRPNTYASPQLQFNFSAFLLRKFWFFHFAKAMVVFPGGIGTLDELFEILTLIKTGKIDHYIPIVLFGSEYWKKVINFDIMVEYGTISPEYMEYCHYSDSVEETFSYITQALEEHHPKPS
tara:strand:- start:57258 stop:58073 length:816 start_codon:yes stop_codon:yes gene_type:complete